MNIQIINFSDMEAYFQADKIAEEFEQCQHALATAERNITAAKDNLARCKCTAEKNKEVFEVNAYAAAKILTGG
jgi:hypothetical protein